MKINNFKKHVNPDSIEMNPEGKGAVVEANEDFVNNMLEQDHPDCKYKRGDIVYKATYDEGDVHEINTPGIVKGTLFEKTVGEAYLVLFEGDEHMCFTIGRKLKSEANV